MVIPTFSAISTSTRQLTPQASFRSLAASPAITRSTITTRNTAANAHKLDAPSTQDTPSPKLDFTTAVENTLSTPPIKNLLSKLEKPPVYFLPYEFGGPLSLLLSVALNEVVASPRTLEFFLLQAASKALLSLKGEIPAELPPEDIHAIMNTSFRGVNEFTLALKSGTVNGDTSVQELKDFGLYDAAHLLPSTRATLAGAADISKEK